MTKKKQDLNLTQAQIDQINDYGNKIKTIESFIEGVRKLPGFYIGAKGNVGWKACIREIFQNSFDELLRTESPCNYIKVTFDERTQGALIEDTGRGIPHGKIVDIYTTERSSSNYDKQPYEYSSGAHGVGSGVAVALSEHFEITSYVLGTAKHVEFSHGLPWKSGEKKIPCPSGRQGTAVYMTPDLEILDHVNLTCNEIRELVVKILPNTNIGDRIDFVGVDMAGNVIFNDILINTDGIVGALNTYATKPIVTPIYFKADTGTMRAEIAFTYDSGDMDSFSDIVSYGNFTPTTAGTHVDGFLNGLCKYLRNYINTFYLVKNTKLKIINNDIKTGLKAVVSAAHLYPVFAGQFKGILSNEDIEGFVATLTYSAMDDWAKRNPNDLQKICKFIKEIAEIRTKTDDSKIKLATNYEKSAISGDPKKFVRPSGRKELELFIVEGDSALGTTKQARNPETQGIFPIRGKMLNAFNTPKARFFQNVEAASIMQIVSKGAYGRNLDPNTVKWDKIIFLADADPDGSHIAGLILRMFLMYYPTLIEAGKIYKAVPPLFGLKQGKHLKYFTDKRELVKYAQAVFMKQNTLCDSNGKPLSPREVNKLFYNHIDYTHDLDVASHILAANTLLLETVLFELAHKISFNVEQQVAMAFAAKKIPIVPPATKEEEVQQANDVRTLIDGSVNTAISYTLLNLDFKEFRSYIEKKYRFIKVHMKNGTIVIEGLVDSKYQYVFLNDYTIKTCIELIRQISKSEYLHFTLNGEPRTLYQVMKVFDSILPNDLHRYKGLGEQNYSELKESTMDPSNRTLIRYTLESAKEEIENIRYIDSNKAALLNGINFTRQDIE